MNARTPQLPSPQAGCKPVHYLFVAAAFAAAYGQAALYYSNQNQYFLHGFAQAGQGSLGNDWLAGTLDPTPLFSRLTAWTMAYLQPWAFHVYQAVLAGIYAAAMLDLFVVLAGGELGRRRWLTFAFLLVLIHSAALRWSCCHWPGPESYRLDYAWYFQAGLASQYVLGAMLQPSVFGVLLVAGLALFMRGRVVLSSLCIAGAVTMHSTYLLPGAMLTAGFLVQLAWEKRYRAGLLVGLLTLALVLPSVIYAVRTFGPTSAEQFARAQDFLANYRIPHHCRVDRWLDVPAGLQIAWVIAAMLLVWRTRLFAVLAVCVALSSVLTAIQAATGSNLLALLFPWRISTILVPVATTIVLSRLVGFGRLKLQPTPAKTWRGAGWLPAAGLAILAAAGVGISLGRWAFQSPVEDVPLMDFVRQNQHPDDVYFLPVKGPDRRKAPTGAIRSLSSDFKTPPEKSKDDRFIPLDLQQFRLHTLAPIFVDFKSIPYKDVEVIEWYDRLLLAEEVQKQIDKGEVREALAKLRERHVTHVVQRADSVLSTQYSVLGLRQVYPPPGGEDPRYRVYEFIGLATTR